MDYNAYLCGTPQRTDKRGYQAVRLYVSFNSQKTYLPLYFKWRPENITKDGLIQGAETHATFNECNKIISDKREQLSKVFKENTICTLEDLNYCLTNPGGKNDFITYWKNKLTERLRLKQISPETYDLHKGSLNILISCTPSLRFDKITLHFLDTYKAWLYGEKYKRNTVWGRLKDFRTYLNLAIKDGLTTAYPFENFKMPKPVSRTEFLLEEEFSALKKYFETTRNEIHKEALRPFIFSCYTGLRVGDIYSIQRKNIRNNVLVFEPEKGQSSETKTIVELRVPIHPYALALVNLNIKRDVKIFRNLPTEQTLNKTYKTIAQEVGIQEFSYHFSRHTFGTRFLAHGGRLEVLQKLMGHEDIKTTLIYAHVEPTQFEKQISLLT